MLAVDPVDGCTFWATGEYYAVPTSAGWQTRIGAFRLPGCGPSVPPPDAPENLTASTLSSTSISLAWTDKSADEGGFQVERCIGSMATPGPMTAARDRAVLEPAARDARAGGMRLTPGLRCLGRDIAQRRSSPGIQAGQPQAQGARDARSLLAGGTLSVSGCAARSFRNQLFAATCMPHVSGVVQALRMPLVSNV